MSMCKRLLLAMGCTEFPVFTWHVLYSSAPFMTKRVAPSTSRRTTAPAAALPAAPAPALSTLPFRTSSGLQRHTDHVVNGHAASQNANTQPPPRYLASADATRSSRNEQTAPQSEAILSALNWGRPEMLSRGIEPVRTLCFFCLANFIIAK